MVVADRRTGGGTTAVVDIDDAVADAWGEDAELVLDDEGKYIYIGAWGWTAVLKLL